ncbi:MAG: hypothetical protein AAGF07_05575 [Patescibacteria group bacterium]
MFDHVYGLYSDKYPNIILGIIVVIFFLSYKYDFGLPIDRPFEWFYRVIDSGKNTKTEEKIEMEQENKHTKKKLFNRKDVLATFAIVFFVLGGKYGLISPYRLYPGQDRVVYTISQLNNQDYLNFCKSEGRYIGYKTFDHDIICYTDKFNLDNLELINMFGL